MALTHSSMLSLGTPAPDFELMDTIDCRKFSLANLTSDIATVIMFLCNHCPYVKHIQKQLVEIATTYQAQGVQFIAICSNDSEAYPEDSPEKMKEIAQALKFPFPYLHDATQAVAKAYDATCTPDFFVFDKQLNLVYRGRFDASTPGNQIPVTGTDLKNALDCLLAGKPILGEQKPSVGCNIKWKKQ